MPASHSCGASTVSVGVLRASMVEGHAGRGPGRHPRRRAPSRGARRAARRPWRGRCGCGRSRACSRNGSSASDRPRAQRVEEHQPVLRPLRAPRWWRAGPRAAAGVVCPHGREQGDALGEQALLPELSDLAPCPRGRAAPRRRPGSARSANFQSGLSRASQRARGPAKARACGRRSVRPRAAFRSAGSSSGGARVAAGVGQRQPLGEQLHQVGAAPRRPPPAGAGLVGEQRREAAPGRGRQRWPGVVGGGLGPGGGGRGAQARSGRRLHGCRVQEGGRSAVRGVRGEYGHRRRCSRPALQRVPRVRWMPGGGGGRCRAARR